MKEIKSITKSKIEEILEHWNKQCEEMGTNENYKLEYRKVSETVTLSDNGKDRTGTVSIGRVTLTLIKLVKNNEEKLEDVQGLLLFKRDFPLSRKQELHKDFHWQEQLSKELLYEMIGNFCVIVRDLAMERIKIQDINELNAKIQRKIIKEESDIINKPESEKNEEDKVFSLMNKAKGEKVKKTGLVNAQGKDILSTED